LFSNTTSDQRSVHFDVDILTFPLDIENLELKDPVELALDEMQLTPAELMIPRQKANLVFVNAQRWKFFDSSKPWVHNEDTLRQFARCVGLWFCLLLITCIKATLPLLAFHLINPHPFNSSCILLIYVSHFQHGEQPQHGFSPEPVIHGHLLNAQPAASDQEGL
jgi:hypothetical protein